MKRIFILLLFTVIIYHNCSDKPQLTLIQNSHSDYVILISENADESLQTAAAVLQEYLYKISGCKLEITRQERETGHYIKILRATAEIHPDGYRIQTKNKNLLISGGEKNGAIYGVTAFLEKYLGCRKFSPAEEYVPARATVEIPAINDVNEPATDFRCVNGAFARDEGYRNWRRTHNIPDMFAHRYFVHTFNRLMPWEEYFEDHPEYYSYITGKRVKDQLCMTHPEVYEIVEKKLAAEMAKQPGEKVWSVSQNDNFTYCQCPACRKIMEAEGSPAGPLLRFVNKLAQRFPDKVISTLAYQWSRPAPKLTKPEDNVQIMLCTIELDRSQPIATAAGSRSFVRDIQDWNAISDRIFLWDYTVNFHHHVAPFPNLHVLQPNIQFFVNNDAHDHFQQTNTGRGHEFSELKAYLISNLLWDPQVNVDSLKQDFLTHYYGDAASWIAKYIDHLESALLESGASMGIYDHPVKMKNTVMSAENSQAYMEYFDQAEMSVQDKDIYLQRVKVARLPIQYALMEIGKNDMFGPRGWYEKTGGDYILNDNMVNRLESFYKVAGTNNVRSINEMGGTPESYYQSTKHFIDVQVEGNLAFEKPVSCVPPASPKYSEGNSQILTNGVQGAGDYKVHWLGWEAQDFSVLLDLERTEQPELIKINSLYFPKSWILHPRSVACYISDDNQEFQKIGRQKIDGDQKHEDEIHTFKFAVNGRAARYIKFDVEGTIGLPNWHPSAGGKSWVFLDEIVVE